MEGFNSHLNVEQMNKALISLNEMYNKAAAEGRPQPNGERQGSAEGSGQRQLWRYSGVRG